MNTLSLRQALSISPNWVVLGVRDDTHVEQQNGVNVQVGSYTEFQVHNVGNTPIAVTCEIRGASGQILLTLADTKRRRAGSRRRSRGQHPLLAGGVLPAECRPLPGVCRCLQ